MAGARRLLSKYWILIVIVLWVIAWANRDWLASNDHPAPDAPAEESVAPSPALTGIPEATATAASGEPEKAEGPVEARAPAEASVPVEARAPAEASVPVEARAPAEASGPVEFRAPAEPSAPAEARVATESSVPVEPRASAKARVPAESPPEGLQVTSPPESAPAPEPVDAVAATDTRQAERAAPAPQTGARVAELLAQARTAQRQSGPRVAADWLIAGLGDIPADAPERADLYGEIGNLHLSMGQFQGALAAYDLALVALPAAERAQMLGRLGPIYDRYHPSGRSYLEQFR